jgi:hypothetical protein
VFVFFAGAAGAGVVSAGFVAGVDGFGRLAGGRRFLAGGCAFLPLLLFLFSPESL